MSNMKENIAVPDGTLTVERTDKHNMQFVRTHADGSEHKVNMYVFSKEQIDALHACLPAAYAKIKKEKRRKKWLRFLRFFGIRLRK